MSTQIPALEVWIRLLRSHTSARRVLSAQLDAEHGLTINDYEALLLLYRAQGEQMRRTDLAQKLLLTPSGVTRLLDGLEAAGLVAKGGCPSDGRVSYAILTRSGRRRLEGASESHIASVCELFEEHFTREELATLAELLGRLPGAADADGSSCRAGSPPS